LTVFLFVFATLLITGTVIFSIFNGYKKHLALLFFTFIQLFYLLYAPWVNLIRNDFTHFNSFDANLEKQDFTFGAFILSLHLILFYFGYLIGFVTKNKISSNLKTSTIELKKKSVYIYIIFFILISINFAFGEISLYDILLGKDESVTLGFKGGTNWISSMADSLIILFIITLYFDINLLFRWIMYPLTIFLFLLLGFRYRFLLLIFGISFLYLKNQKLNFLKTFKIFLIFLSFFYFFMVISENRSNFYTNKYDNIVLNPLTFDYESIYNNSLGSIVDFTLYKNLNNGTIVYDYGESMFVYPIIMFLPSSLFNNNEKPYPAPQIKNIDDALNVPRSYGQACTFIGMTYNAFSVYGVIFFSTILGLFTSKLEYNNSKGPNLFIKIATILSLFQLYTRGYLGLFLLPLFFMYLPIFLMKLKFKLY